MTMTKNARLIAFYLPQYHPIPENDDWWGKGFTEWTNVTKAKPLFDGHQQPHLPTELGFYDLRVPEAREAQADLAKSYGIEGFCYWHYWFAGKRLLERPFDEVLASGKPDFPFCLAWANQSWTGIWHGAPDKTLIEQTYPGVADYEDHFNYLLPAFNDPRYIRVDGKPIFIVYKPKYLPEPEKTIHLWKRFAAKAGLEDLFIVGVINHEDDVANYNLAGFDGFTINTIPWPRKEEKNIFLNLLFRVLGKEKAIRLYQKLLNRPYHVYKFSEASKMMIKEQRFNFEYYPCIIPNWDNTPRSGLNGYVGTDCSPVLFKEQLVKALHRVDDYPDEHQLVFIKSWNEWAEGNYLEPDQTVGRGYLEALHEGLNGK